MSNTSLVRLCAAILLGMTGAAAQDRMPPIPADKMTEAQKKAAAELAAGPRGGFRGPFVPLVRSPELMNRVQKVGEYLRYNNSLPQKLVEMTVLMTARRWTQQFEWNAHYPLALKAGLKKEVADAIAEGRHPAGMAEARAAPAPSGWACRPWRAESARPGSSAIARGRTPPLPQAGFRVRRFA